jgi:beta-N-acetylhexosaminidase
VAADVRDAADPPAHIGTIVAADQEGGLVQRLKGPGFSDMPSALTQSGRSDTELSADASRWAAELERAGIDVDLAPVADVVPANLLRVNAPIGQLRRGYGPSPSVVARKVKAVVGGMRSSDIGTAVKHFPGLGRVRGNTDFTPRVVDSVTTRHDPTLAGFEAGVRAKTAMVMVSSAYYSRIDAERRAAFSPTVIKTMLRGDLGFTGVVISDDLSARAMQDLAPGDRAIRFIRAGGDLAIVGNADEAGAMAAAVLAQARRDKAFAARVAASATRVVELKSQLGLASCRRGH